MTFTAKLKIFRKSVSLHYTVPGGGKLLKSLLLKRQIIKRNEETLCALSSTFLYCFCTNIINYKLFNKIEYDV